MVSQRFLERYLAGEHVPVWRELIELGGNVCNEPLRSEALRVCEEIVRRARFNLRTLHARLLDLGYVFEDPSNSLVHAGPDAGVEIDKIEQELGALPLIARVWYRTFGSVNFCQAEHERMFKYTGDMRPPHGPDIFGLGSSCVLFFHSLDGCRAERQRMDAEREESLRQMDAETKEYFREMAAQLDEERRQNEEEPVKSRQFLPLGGSASNCEPKGFELPCVGVDGVIYDDDIGDGTSGTYFLDELREAFHWGGFPFWKSIFTNRDFYLPIHYRPNYEKLLPVLKDGLLEL
jgi:hypothetical protein